MSRWACAFIDHNIICALSLFQCTSCLPQIRTNLNLNTIELNGTNKSMNQFINDHSCWPFINVSIFNSFNNSNKPIIVFLFLFNLFSFFLFVSLMHTLHQWTSKIFTICFCGNVQIDYIDEMVSNQVSHWLRLHLTNWIISSFIIIIFF